MWHVVSGHYDDVSLDGTTFGQFGLYPEAIHMGNGTVFDVVDEKLNPEQRQAVETLLTEVEPFSVFHAWQPLSWGFSTSPWNCTWTGFAAASRSLASWI